MFREVNQVGSAKIGDGCTEKESERREAGERYSLTRAVMKGIQESLASSHGGCSLNPRYWGKGCRFHRDAAPRGEK